jgi:hypothetical protein
MPIERPPDVPLGMPSLGALQMAIDAMGRHYVLPETMEHPAVRSECMRFAYLIQAYGLASTRPAPRHARIEEPPDAGSLQCASTPPFRDCSRHFGRMNQYGQTRELVDA